MTLNRNTGNQTTDLPVDILPTPYYYSLRILYATMTGFQPEQMPGRPSLKRIFLRSATFSALAFAATSFLHSSATPGKSFSSFAAQNESRLLSQGQPVQDTLKGGDTRAYHVVLQAGDFLHVVADQRGIDVVLAVSGPDGKD